MMSIYDFIDDLNEKMERRIFDMNSCNCYDTKIGLDGRCGRIYLDEECIIIEKSRRGNLDYYGGFEYVDKDFIQEIGDYVIYLNGDERVLGHIERYYETHLRPSEEAA